MRFKLLLILLFVCGGAGSWTYWQFNSNIWNSQKAQLSQQLQLQTAALKVSVESELKAISASIENGILKSYRPQVLASGIYDPKSPTGFVPATVSELFDFKKISPAVQVALKEYQSGIEKQVWIVVDDEKVPTLIYAWTTYSTNPPANFVSVALLKGDFLQNIFQSFGSGGTNSFLANTQGQALAHTNKDYFGMGFVDNPIFKKWKAEGSPSISLDTGNMIGVSEAVGQGNFAIFASIDSKSFLSGWIHLRNQSLFIFGGLFFIGVVMMLFFYRPEVKMISIPVATPAAPQVNKLKAAPENFNDKVTAYAKVASSIAYGINGPLTTLLSQIRLLRVKVQQVPELSTGFDLSLKKMEEEARAGRELLQKLLVFAGEKMSPPQLASLETVLQAAAKTFENRFSAKSIKFDLQIEKVTSFEFPEDLMQKAIENLFLNAMDAVEKKQKREVSAKLSQKGELIELSITDNGEGIATENLQKVVDPFFTTRQFSQKVGLGLSMVYGVVKSSNGKILFSSTLDLGTTVTLVFDLKVAPLDLSVKGGKAPQVRSTSELDKDIVDDMLEEFSKEAKKNIEVQPMTTTSTRAEFTGTKSKIEVDSRITKPMLNIKPRQDAIDELTKKGKV